MAWFFVEDPLNAGTSGTPRWVQRGFLLHGGQQEDATGAMTAILDDLWLFDLSNLGTGVCPWVRLNGSTGVARTAGAMVWDEPNERFLLAGGYEEDALSLLTSGDVWSVTLADAVAGATFTLEGSLPGVPYATASLGDHESGVVQPMALCTGEQTLPCDTTMGSIAAGFLLGDYCTNGGALNENYVTGSAVVDPCLPTASCVSSDGTNDEWANIYLYEACRVDPYCTERDSAGESDGDSVYAEPSVSGLAELAGTFDPSTGIVRWLAGTAGCEGSCSSEMESLFAADTIGGQSSTAANADAVIEQAGTLAVFDDGQTSSPPSSSFPGPASYGRRGIGAAAVGLTWDPDIREWTGASYRTAIVGGTLHQDLGPGRQHGIVCADDMDLCDAFCLEYESAWTPLAAPFSDALEGLVEGASTVVSSPHDGSGWTSHVAIGPRLYPAVAAFGEERVFVFGGTDGSDLSDLWVVDLGTNETLAYSAASELGARHGARAVFDPVTNSAWIFGGSGASADVYEARVDGLYVAEGDEDLWMIDPDYATATNPSMRVTVETSSASLPLGATWTVVSEFTLGVCHACWLGELDLVMPSQVTTELDSLVVEVTYPDDPDPWTLAAYETNRMSSPVGALASVRLPRIVTGGDHVSVRATWTRGSRNSLGGFDACSRGEANAGADYSVCQWTAGVDDPNTREVAENLTGWALQGLPATPALVADKAIGVMTTFTLPSGLVGVAPGARSTSGEFGPFYYLNWDGYGAHVLSGAAEVATFAGSSRYGVTTWVDGGLPTSIAYPRQTSASPNVGEDLAWLEDRFGDLRNGTQNLVFVRMNRGSTVSGEYWAGTSFVNASLPEGGALPDASVQGIAVHELAHSWVEGWWGTRGGYADSARWFQEGLPRLVEYMRVPTGLTSIAVTYGLGASHYTASDVFYPTVRELAYRTCANLVDDLEQNWNDNVVAYSFGAYTLAQGYYSYLGTGGTEAGWWTAVQGFLDEETSYVTHPSGADAAAVETLLASRLGLPYFYAEWVGEGRVGTPLLALEAWSTADGGSPDTGDTGSTGLGGPHLRLRQVQQITETIAGGCSADTPVFHDVPFLVGCDSVDWPGTTAFQECVATRSALLTEEVRLLAGAETEVALTRETFISDEGDDPIYVAVLANDALLPGALPSAGSASSSLGGRPMRWFLACGPDDTTDACGLDGDADGFPAEADCDDAEAAVYPGVEPGTTGLYTDDNCDGWE